jgi:dTMP kinase
MFIVFEGIDGSGKSTQAHLLANLFKSRGIDFVLTREPSGGKIGKRLRSLSVRLSPEEEFTLFLEDRVDHVRTLIAPALEAGKHVICDRYYYSSAAYQGSQGLDPVGILKKNQSLALVPDIVFLICVSVETALERIGKSRPAGYSIFEKRRDLEAVSAIYDTFDEPVIKRIDGNQLASEAHAEIVRWLELKGVKF